MITWGIGAWQTYVKADQIRFVHRSEELGFGQYWYGNEKLYPDMMVGLAVAALHTQRMELGTFIADPYSVHPALTAAAVATLDHLTGGRMVLIMGAGGSGLRELGITRKSPPVAIEEAVTVIRRLLAGETVTWDGRFVKAEGAQLHFPVRPDIPIWVATRGEQMLTLAGRLADGAMIGTFARPAEIRQALASVRKGATSAGRSMDQLTICSRVDTCVADDGRLAREAVKSFLAGVLSASWPDQGFVKQAGLTVPAQLEQVCRAKDLQLAWQSGSLVPDAFVDAFAWAGTPNEVAEKVARVVDLGIRHVTVMFHPLPGQPVERQLELFAQEVMPRVRALGCT